jgi:hypothetical protein
MLLRYHFHERYQDANRFANLVYGRAAGLAAVHATGAVSHCGCAAGLPCAANSATLKGATRIFNVADSFCRIMLSAYCWAAGE